MKRLFVIGLFLLLAMAGCHPKQDDSVETQNFASLPVPSLEMQAIDSLAWQQPDSALALLLPWFDTCRDEMLAPPTNDADTALEETHSRRLYNRHYAQLLLAELLYKKDHVQTNREELQQAVAYFDSLVPVCYADAPPASANATVFLAARAHYINGVGYYESDSVVQACREYLKALEIMEEYFDEKELVGKRARFMALDYTHLTTLFSDQYLHEQAIYFGKTALEYYPKYDATSWHKAWILNEIGSHYEMMETLDSAELYYQKAISILDDTTQLMYRDVSTHLAYLSYKKDKTFQYSVNHLYRLLLNAESEKEFLARCLIIGDIYYSEKQLDSAYAYFNETFQHSLSVGARKQAAELLVKICEQQGRNAEALDYARFLAPFANLNENQGHMKSQLTKTIHDYEREKLEIAHRRQLREFRKHRGAVMVLLATLAAIFVAFHFVHKKRHKHLRSQKEAVEKQLETERYANEIQKKALAGKLKRNKETLRSHLEEKENLRKAMETQQKQAEWSDLNSFMDEDICKEIMDALQDKNIKREAKSDDYLDLKLSTVQLSRLGMAVEKHFHGFTKMLTDLFPRISGDEINQCQLYLLNLEDVKIAHLLSCDYSTVKKRSRKLKNAFHTEKTLRQFVRELVL